MKNICKYFFLFLIPIIFISDAHAASSCEPGCHLDGGICNPCDTGTYENNGNCIACPAGQTGNILTGATSCVNYRTWNTSNGVSAFLRSTKTTTPSLMIKDSVGGIYYGNLSSTLPGVFKLVHNGTLYSLAEQGKLQSSCGGIPSGFRVMLDGINPSDTFNFQISAPGNYAIHWGDGNMDTVNKAGTALTTYSHVYAAGGNYTVTIGGGATGYSNNTTTAAISFYNSINKNKIVGIDGDLGAIFPILNTSDTGSPRFYRTFKDCINMAGEVPSDLFAGIVGLPVTNMFAETFMGCTSIDSIGDGLFDGLIAQ
ncbi:MAG: hypothetical protein FWE50_00445 [Alphaproteobacteria bacterium]|nr:hypothetical protein [Alphaproteobacteria bacterium]